MKYTKSIHNELLTRSIFPGNSNVIIAYKRWSSGEDNRHFRGEYLHFKSDFKIVFEL